MSAQAEHSRRRLPVVGGLPGAAYIGDRLNDVVTLLSALPEIVVLLRAIESHIGHVNAEVTRMREGVDRLADQVGELGDGMHELGSGINEVSASVGRLEPHISDLSRLARPLRRRRRTDTGNSLEPPAVPGADDDASLSSHGSAVNRIEPPESSDSAAS